MTILLMLATSGLNLKVVDLLIEADSVLEGAFSALEARGDLTQLAATVERRLDIAAGVDTNLKNVRRDSEVPCSKL